ncbi:multidrug efflux MFS transporter [Amycolatopsis sp. NBC_00345]|uniref:MDR family MFS transporter n=1 Tax=Amycolatopsis sp. NBC_00345 TaxID=2975955 RepID=UPI002E25D4E6
MTEPHRQGVVGGIRETVSRPAAVAVVYVAVMFLSTMDSTIVNVALPTIGRAFSVPSTAVDSVSIAYLVSLAVFVPASGWLGDRFGGKRTLLTAIAVFTIASELCGIASSLGELVLFRVVQGAGGGLLTSVGMAMLMRAYPPRSRVRVSAMITLATGVSPAVGPVLGGLLVTDLSWRAVFSVNVPIGVAALVFGAVFLRRDDQHLPAEFDTAGFLLAASGLGLAMYGVSMGPRDGWTSPEVLASVAAGVVLLIALVVLELRRSAPIVDVRLLLDRLFGNATAIMAIESVTFLGTLYTVSLYFQDGRGMSALDSGLSTFPEALGVITGSQLGSRLLYRGLGPRRHLMAGIAGTSLFIAVLGLLGTDTNLWAVRVVLFGMGLSVGQVFVAGQAVAFAGISPADSGRASTLFNVGRRLGGAIGVAVTTTVIVLAGAPTEGRIAPSAYHLAFFVAAAINLLGLLSARAVRKGDAANTIPPPRTKKKGNQHHAVLEPSVGDRRRGTGQSA